MRNMSFALTTPQILARTKTVTRRTGWAFLKPGDRIQAVEKGMGLKKGETVRRLAVLRVESVSRGPLQQCLTQADVAREGFPDMTEDAFVEMFCRTHKGCTPDTVITRIAFSYRMKENPMPTKKKAKKNPEMAHEWLTHRYVCTSEMVRKAANVLRDALAAQAQEIADLKRKRVTKRERREWDDIQGEAATLRGYIRETGETPMMTRSRLERAEAELAQVRSRLTAVEQGWQQIGTAPKDGTTVLLFHKGAMEPDYVTVAEYVTFETSEHHYRSGWCSADTGQYVDESGAPPSHWMPLPTSPQTPADRQ